jgi:methyl coenzyme M reductase alpha subunit
MWQERIKRILIIIGVASLVLLGGQAFARWQAKQSQAGESVELPTQTITSKIEEIGEDILGKAVEVLPGVEKETQETTTTPTETTKLIETQTKEIIEIIKQLPQEQVDQIKKQIFKDFCQEVMK